MASLKHNDNQMKAELLNNYFTLVFTPHSSRPPPIIPDTSFPDIATISVDINGVLNLLNEQDTSKATGPDNIPAHFLKISAIEVAPILTLIFQASIHQSSVPPDCKQANIETSKYCLNIQKRRPYPLQQLHTCIINMHMLQDFRTYYVFTHILPPLTTQHIV